MIWGEHLARMGEMRGAYSLLVGKPEGKTQFGRPRRRWENNIKMVLQKSGMGHGLDCSGSVQEQVTGRFECGNEHSGSIKFGEFLDYLRTG